MRSVGLKVLRKKLGQYVRIAAGGETVLVTDRDRVVAEIVPPQGGRSPAVADAMLAEAAREGWFVPPTVVASRAPPRRPVMTFGELMRDVDANRNDTAPEVKLRRQKSVDKAFGRYRWSGDLRESRKGRGPIR